MLTTNFIRQNKVSFAIFIFLIVLGFIHNAKPNFLYKKDDTFREFGLGYIKKTVLPIWLIVIVVAILSYLMVLYYLRHPKIIY